MAELQLAAQPECAKARTGGAGLVHVHFGPSVKHWAMEKEVNLIRALAVL